MAEKPDKNGTIHTCISPKTWGLEPAGDCDTTYLNAVGLQKDDLENRARNNTYEWLRRQFNHDAGAFNGFYDPRSGTFAPPQTVNLIAPFQLMAAFDRYQDEELLDLARRAADWLEANMVETHPMSVVLGGVRDNIKVHQLWTKYAADYVTLNLGLWGRLEDEVYLTRGLQSSKFLLQSQGHNFATKYDDWAERWIETGWQSFGRVIDGMMALYEYTDNDRWLMRSRDWAEYALTLQADNGCFYLINDNYYSSDIAADEIRAFVRMYHRWDDTRYLEAATGFGDWHLANQCTDGAWPLSEDRCGVSVGEYIGPGDIPNIAVALLLLHRATNEPNYVAAAARALQYSLSQQQLPDEEGAPYIDDPVTHWGFWSWDPPYDYTMSADQSTHHVRGYWFFLDYFLSLSEDEQKKIAETYKGTQPTTDGSSGC
jgi:hypothetical protein